MSEIIAEKIAKRIWQHCEDYDWGNGKAMLCRLDFERIVREELKLTQWGNMLIVAIKEEEKKLPLGDMDFDKFAIKVSKRFMGLLLPEGEQPLKDTMSKGGLDESTNC